MNDMREDQLSDDAAKAEDRVEALRQGLLKEISLLNRLSIRGVLALALFIIISFLAWQGFLFLPDPDVITAVLGPPPSANIVSVALLIYTFSAILLSLSRMTAAIEHRSSFGHVGFLTGFFTFYYFGKSLEANYWAVFGAGITILGVESYRIWTFCAEAISRKREDLDYVNRTGRPPLKE